MLSDSQYQVSEDLSALVVVVCLKQQGALLLSSLAFADKDFVQTRSLKTDCATKLYKSKEKS